MNKVLRLKLFYKKIEYTHIQPAGAHSARTERTASQQSQNETERKAKRQTKQHRGKNLITELS